jgi:carbonic anhydrase/acetyltransferase-like protein (isoleucine patch superfamily)
LDPKVAKPSYTRTLRVKAGALITSKHSFDVCGSITIGEKTWIAGSHSQFWTHGAGDVGDIEIGTNCYVGSAARFSSNSGLGNNVLLALGSVVTKRLMEDNTLVGGVPAKVLKTSYHWKEQAGK